MIFQTSLGIDIQHNSVSLAYLRASFKGVKLVEQATYTLEAGIAENQKPDVVGGFVKSFVGGKGVSPAAVFLGIPRDMTILRYVELPLVVRENLKESLKYELEKYVPFPANELYFDYQVVAEDKKAQKLKLLLLTTKRKSIDPYVTLQKQFGARLSGIEIGSTAVANFFAMNPEFGVKELYALIYSRQDGLEIDVLKSGFLTYSRQMDTSQWGPGFPNEILQELKKIKETLTDHQGPLKTVLCNVDRESVLTDHLKGDEAFDVHYSDSYLTDGPSPDMIPAYGLALKGLQEVPTDVNLLPEEMRKKPGKVGHYAMWGLAGVALLLVLAWGGGTIFNTQRYLKQLDSELSRLKVEVSDLEEIRTECTRMEGRIDFLNPIRNNRLIVLDVIKELSVRVPKDAWVLRLTFSDKDKEIEIQGWADSASELVPSLDDSPLFKDVGFLSSITRSNAGKERFRIGLKLKNKKDESRN